jgi:hypothetical protein
VVVTAAAEEVVEVAVTELVPITEPILDWTGVKLDPDVYDPESYGLESQGLRMVFVCYNGCWDLPLEWIDGACWTVWDYHGERKGEKHMQVSLVRDLGMVREKREKSLAEVARLNQSLGMEGLDLDEIRQRHLGGDAQALPEGHVLADLARLIAEVESYRRAPTLPEPPKTPVAEAPKYPDEIPF